MRFPTIGFGGPSFPKLASRSSDLASRFSVELNKLVDQVLLDAGIPRQNVRAEHLRKGGFFAQHALNLGLVQRHGLAPIMAEAVAK